MAILAGNGVLLGLVASGGLMRAALFGISPLNPITYTAVPAILMLAALAASYLPARRIAAVDPIETLRADC